MSTTLDSSILSPTARSNFGACILGVPYSRAFLLTHITWVLIVKKLPISGVRLTKCGKPWAQDCGARSRKKNPDGILITKGCGNLAALALQTSVPGPLHRTPAT